MMIFTRIRELIRYRITAISRAWWVLLATLLVLEVIWLLIVRKKSYFNRLMNHMALIDWFMLVMISTVLSRKVLEPHSLDQLISYNISTAWTTGPGIYGAIDTYTELVMNILMFVPFGYLLAKLSGGRKWIVFGGSFLITLSIETLQLVLRRGFFELADILLNMTGAALGYAAYRILRRLVEKWKKHSAQAD